MNQENNEDYNEKEKDPGLLSTLGLILWYLFLTGLAIVALGAVALFVVCMV